MMQPGSHAERHGEEFNERGTGCAARVKLAGNWIGRAARFLTAEGKVSRKGAKLAKEKSKDQKCFLCASAPLREVPAIQRKDADA